jgi:hypothetical protein
MRVMNKFLHYTITVPLLALPIATAAPKFALSEITSPVQALELLAKSKEIDLKCRRLSAAERQELSDYAARAEIAVARRNSAADAQAAITIGKAKGNAAKCDEATLTKVRETLSAARRALANLPSRVAETDGGLIIENRTSMPMRPSLIEPATPKFSTSIPSVDIEKAVPKAVDGLPRRNNLLTDYRKAATAYYVERRCGHLSHRDAQEFWNRIVERHHEVTAHNKKRAVSATLEAAEAAANALPCGKKTAQLVHQSYAAIRTP